MLLDNLVLQYLAETLDKHCLVFDFHDSPVAPLQLPYLDFGFVSFGKADLSSQIVPLLIILELLNYIARLGERSQLHRQIWPLWLHNLVNSEGDN